MAPQPASSRKRLTGYTERRLHSRLAIVRDVRLSWQDRQGNHSVRARALDMSKYGLLVEAESEIALGVVVFIGTGAVLFGRGCVRHCTQNGPKYLIGLNTPDRMTALMVSLGSPNGGASR
jgi:hypothetical protein